MQEGTFFDTRHAAERKSERDISLLEVIHVLKGGYHERKKDEFKPEHNDWSYSIRGKTVDKRPLRVVVAFAEPGMLVITAIDLGAD